VKRPRPTIFTYESVGSTLDEAQKLAKQHGCPFYIFAQEQTQGRGRMGRVWHSPQGNIYFTACFEANLPPAQLPLFTLYAALCVCRGLNRLFGDDKLWLKWPNDIWAGKKKCAGFLAEVTQVRCVGRRLFLGMGLNVETQTFPGDLKKTATSLKKIFGRKPRAGTLERLLCREVGGAYEKFEAGEYESELFELWNRYGKLVGRTLRFEYNGRQTEGKAIGIAHDGALCVKTKQGVLGLRSGEVTLSAGLRRSS